MKFTKQRNTFVVNNALDVVDRQTQQRHGILLPNTIRALICGPSNCGKTNLMFSLLTESNGLRFENVYIFSKSLQQPKYVLLSKILHKIPEIGYYTFDNSEDVKSPNEAKPNSIMVFDDVACDSQDNMRAYFSMGRHNLIDSFYLTQTYTKVPKHLLRDNANLIILFKQDELNLKHAYDEHVSGDMSLAKFKEMCLQCWNRADYSFVVINKDAELNKGRYRCGLDTFISGI